MLINLEPKNGSLVSNHNQTVLQREGGEPPQELKDAGTGTSLVVQWLRLCVSNAGGLGSIPGGGTKIPHAM